MSMTPEQMVAALVELDIDSSDEEQENAATNLHSSTNTHLSYLVQPRLHGKRQRLPSLKVLWIRIFSYSGPTEKETVSFRCLCKLFSQALKSLPCWTLFPHPKYSTLNKLFDRLNELYSFGETNVPKVVLIENGIYEIQIYQKRYYVDINLPITIVGESREHCLIVGGLRMSEKKEDGVNVKNLTLCTTYDSRVRRSNNTSLDNVSEVGSGNHPSYRHTGLSEYLRQEKIIQEKISGNKLVGCTDLCATKCLYSEQTIRSHEELSSTQKSVIQSIIDDY